MNKPVIEVQVVSDVVCPWCYIGKRRLESAMNALSTEFDFNISYLPFELNPSMPQNGVNQREYLSNKFGGEEQYERITAHTAQVAAQEGLDFRFEKQQTSPNTRNAHRLIMYAKDHNLQLTLVEALFRAYFIDGVNLSKIENLVKIAASCGLNEKAVEEFLHSQEGAAEVEATEQQIQRLGISGVPFYIINNQYGVSGAQAPETFIQAFREVNKQVTAISGEACDVDGTNC